MGPMDVHIAEMCRKDERIAEMEAKVERLENALLLIHDRACYSLGVTDDWLMQICGEALEGEP